MQTQWPSTDWNPQLISKRVAPWMNTLMNSRTLSQKLATPILKTIVVKFHRGLNTQIQNAIATIPSGCPSDMVLTDWYTAARTIDQNWATNESFRSSYQTPSVAPTKTCPSTFNTVQFQAPEQSVNHQHAPTPRNPVPMDINTSQKMQPLLFSCYRCRKAGHKASNCPTQFDIRELSIDDLQTYLEDRLAELNAKHPVICMPSTISSRLQC